MTIQAVPAQSQKQNITSLLVSMGVKVEAVLDRAIAGLLSRTHVADGLLESAMAVQELEVAVDQAVFSAFQSGEFLSSDLRHVTSVVNISKELARVARVAANLGRRLSQVGEHCDEEDLSRLQPLAIAVSHLCRQSLRALTHLDPVLARNAASGKATVDTYRDYVYRSLSQPQPITNEQNRHLLFASRCLEQIADHLSELAENLVIFLAAGPLRQGKSLESHAQIAC
jgi:phosphate transport system protein